MGWADRGVQQVKAKRAGKPMRRHLLHIVLGSVAMFVGITVASASTLYGINHTHWAINRFSVDGRSAVDSIGRYQGGGGGCCYTAPARWYPGLTVRVDWETGVGHTRDFPGTGDWPRFLAWEKKILAQKRRHSKVVAVPDYTGQKVCGITVHFLPCDDIQVTTSCYGYGTPSIRSKPRWNCRSHSHVPVESRGICGLRWSVFAPVRAVC